MKLDSKGCNVLLSNSNSKQVVECFQVKLGKLIKLRQIVQLIQIQIKELDILNY